ncbi:MAG: hypothetical protein QNJ70_04465 [Xenococcaceae cyanobacterium MO_207.B15]|nr:hypothetical protein [Xenococcaceae cyanobacterium MO_207.B15]
MKTIWKQSLFRAMVWLSAEIILNCVGLDDLADYSEFIFERDIIALNHIHLIAKTSIKL